MKFHYGSGIAGGLGKFFNGIFGADWKYRNEKTTSNKNNFALIDEIKDVVASQLNISKSQITNTASFVDDLNADSLDLVELVMELEKRYDIKIPQEDQEKIQNISDVVKYIEDNKKK